MSGEPCLRRVRLRNYKSIRECDVELGRLTILVGRNGSGKSNFLDAIAFLSDVLRTPIVETVERRGWMRSIMHRSAQKGVAEVDFVIELRIDDERQAEYGLSLGETGNLPVVRREWLVTTKPGDIRRTIFETCDGEITSDALDLKGWRPPALGLSLPLLTGIDSARRVFETLQQFRVYDPQPKHMRERVPVNIAALKPDGSNAASVMSRLQDIDPRQAKRLVDFLSAAIDDSEAIGVRAEGSPDSGRPAEARLRFYFDRAGSTESFDDRDVSDGTLRVLAVLLAAMQRSQDGRPVPVIAIEEPEVGLHPAASGAVMEALREASLSSQVLVTTHSPDLLDQSDVENDTLRVVQNDGGETRIGPPGDVSLSIIRDHLYSPGELFRTNQLEPALTTFEGQPIPATEG